MEIDRENFTPAELACCLSHYDLGEITAIRDFIRGSRRSPKVVIDSSRGRFLFKRRARGLDELAKVNFTHEIQQHLTMRDFPLPELIPTKDARTVLVLEENVYEMFEFVTGSGYDGSPAATFDSGRTLAMYHSLLADFQAAHRPPSGSYHNADSIRQAVRNTVSSLPLAGRPPAHVVTGAAEWLHHSYVMCAEQADSAGLPNWPKQTVHGDWHPGNMLFRGHAVAAVVDYDAARWQQRVIDLANGALQFSIIGGGNDPAAWPDEADVARLGQFVQGYASLCLVSERELDTIPYLMCEAMIAEAVLPIAATGSFGRFSGFSFLQMIDRKVKWIMGHMKELTGVLED